MTKPNLFHNHARCHHLLCEYLIKRCKNNNLIFESENENYDTFTIRKNDENTNEVTYVKFVRNAETKTFMINDLIEIQNEHLLGLNIPNRLFELFDILQNIKATTDLNISIFKNKFLISNCPPCLDENSLFEKLSNLNIPEKFKEFRIQIADNNLFAFNRCLKMESKVLNILLEKNVNFVEMAVKYFNCFSISPTCARMQSLADDATFHVLDEYSHLHVNLYLEDYITISKLFFPFISNVRNEFLLKNYLEIIPAEIIRKCLPAELIEIIQSIKQTFKDDFKIEHLQNESCCISPFLNIYYRTFVRLTDVNRLKKALDLLKEHFDSNIFLKETNLWFYDSDSHIEFKNAIFIDENFETEKTVDVENTSNCRYNCKCKNSVDVISFFKLKEKFVLAIARNVNDKEKIVIRCFIMMLEKAFSSLNYLIPLDNIFAEVDSFPENFLVNNEGISLTLLNNVIYLSNNNLLEHLYQRVKDNFYFSEEDLLKFFKEISTENMKDIIYRITKRGYICFNGCLKISPAVFLLIKNRKEFFKAIFQFKNPETKKPGKLEEIKMRKKKFTTEVHMKYCSVYASATVFEGKLIDWHAFEDKNLLINIIKCLFPKLQRLDDKYFQNEHFCALPYTIAFIKNREKVLIDCKNLMKHKILFRIKKGNYLEFNNLLEISCKSFQYVTLSTVFEGLQYLEEISSKFRFSCRIRQIQLLSFHDEKFCNFNILEPSEKNFEVLKKALIKIETNFPFSTVIVHRENIMLNNGLIVNPLLIEHLSVNDILKLLKLAKFLYGYIDNLSLNDWISIIDEKKENTKPQNFSETFSLVDTNEHIYLKIAKLLKPALNFFSNDELMSYQCLKLLPQNLVMKNPKYLLEKLEKMHNEKYDLKTELYGTFLIDNFRFTLNQLLQCKNLHIFKSIPLILKSLEKKSFEKHYLRLNGQFGLKKAMSEVSEMYSVSQMNFKMLENFITEGATLRFNSKGFIQLGEFIWFHIDECTHIITSDILMLANEYDAAMPKPEKTLMKSIYNLKNPKHAKLIAKELNNLMQGNIADRVLSKENFLAFPVDLYDMWIKNPENAFCSTTKALKEIKKLHLYWTFTLNGYLCINDRFMITLSQLLVINIFEKLADLMRLLSYDIPLLCEEEIINGKGEKLFLLKIVSYYDIYTIKSKAEHISKCINVEPNGTLLVNENIWVHPHQYLRDEEKIISMSKTLNEIFGGVNYRFQYGGWNDCVVTSILKTPEENFYDFCHTFCNFIKEIDDSISIKYYAKKRQFNFNDCLFIHPQSFFHLQNIEAFVSALKAYSSGTEEEKTKTFLEELCKSQQTKDSTNLWTIQSMERVEFLPLRKFVLQEIGKLVMKFTGKQKPDLTEFFVTPEENFYLIEKLVIKGEHLFTEGMAYDFILEKNKEDLKKNPNENFKYKFRYNEDVFFMALSMCAGPDDEFKSKNLFDLQSLLESIMGYCEGKTVINDEMCKGSKPNPLPSMNNMPEFEKMITVFKNELQRISEIQNVFETNNKLIFYNSLKALHHWYKHGDETEFKKIDIYYTKMNHFIENCKKRERFLKTQDGLKLLENFEDGIFMAGTCLEESTQKKFVTTFRMLGKRKKEKKSFFILFADGAFPSDVSLCPDIKFYPVELKKLLNVIKNLPKTPLPDKIIVILNIPTGTPNRFKEIIDAIQQKFNKELQIFFHCENAADFENDLKNNGFDLKNVTFLEDPYIERTKDEWRAFVETALQINQNP